MYLGSFWDAPLRLEDNRALLEREKGDLLNEMMALPQVYYIYIYSSPGPGPGRGPILTLTPNLTVLPQVTAGFAALGIALYR